MMATLGYLSVDLIAVDVALGAWRTLAIEMGFAPRLARELAEFLAHRARGEVSTTPTPIPDQAARLSAKERERAHELFEACQENPTGPVEVSRVVALHGGDDEGILAPLVESGRAEGGEVERAAWDGWLENLKRDKGEAFLAHFLG